SKGSPPSSLSFEQYYHRPTTAFRRPRLAVGEYLVAPHEPGGHLVLQDRLAVLRPQALAVHDAHAPQSPARAFRAKFREQLAGIGGVAPVQIELVLDDPVAAAQLPQHGGAEPVAQEGKLLARLLIAVRRNALQALAQGRLLVAPRLQRQRVRPLDIVRHP